MSLEVKRKRLHYIFKRYKHHFIETTTREAINALCFEIFPLKLEKLEKSQFEQDIQKNI